MKGKGKNGKARHHNEPVPENNLAADKKADAIHNTNDNTASGNGCKGGLLKISGPLSAEELAGLRLDRTEWYCDANGRGEELARVIIKNGWEGAIPQIAKALAACPWETKDSFYFEDYLDRWVGWIKAKEVAAK